MEATRIAQLSRFHRKLGLFFSVPLLVMGLSGIILGFYDGLRYGFPPYRLENPVSRPLDPAALAAAAQSSYPGARLQVLYLPASPERATRALLSGDAGGRIVFLDSGTGKPVAVRDAADRDLLGVLYEIHRGKIAGLAGEIVVAAVAVSLVLLWLSGLPLRRRGSKARHLHGRLGRELGGVLAVIAVTGGILAFAKPLRHHLYPPPVSTVAKTLPSPDLARVIAVGREAYSGAPLERVLFPAADDKPLTLRFQDGGRVWLDANGEVLRKETPYSPWMNMLYPLHSGRIMGEIGPPLVAAFGALSLFLTGSGYLLCRRRKKKLH